MSNSAVLCKVPSVPIWGSIDANDTSCSLPQGCRVDHLVTIIPSENSSFSLSYVYDCQCDGTQCYDHYFNQGDNATFCEDVNECAILCDGTRCPSNDCDLNAVCNNTNGSFTCSCDLGFSGLSSVGTTCILCPASKYKDTQSNDNCTHCGSYFSWCSGQSSLL